MMPDAVIQGDGSDGIKLNPIVIANSERRVAVRIEKEQDRRVEVPSAGIDMHLAGGARVDPGVDRKIIALEIQRTGIGNSDILAVAVEVKRLANFAGIKARTIFEHTIVAVLTISRVAFGFPPTDHSGRRGRTTLSGCAGECDCAACNPVAGTTARRH